MPGPLLSILWFRHGLRLHDSPALHDAIEKIAKNTDGVGLLPIFIYDGETAGTKLCGYNRFKFLTECLQDVDEQLRDFDSKLYCFSGRPVDILTALHKTKGIARICFEQDCEPVWKTRDVQVKNWCDDNGVEWSEKIGHTLWNPHEIIEMNAGTPPCTFSLFNYITTSMPAPARPLDDVDLSAVKMAKVTQDDLKDFAETAKLFECVPEPGYFGIKREFKNGGGKVYFGGERKALTALEKRLVFEAKAFRVDSFLPNQRDPDILCPPKSLSPDLRFGTLSVRKFYWGVIDEFRKSMKEKEDTTDKKKPFNPQIVVQLLWREFFYTMSVNNDHFDQMKNNPICINIDWYPIEKNKHWDAFAQARTGFPFIDAGMRQLYNEGWIHHILRNAIACFLTRGDLWISWEPGLRLFYKYLLDADFSVCAGNWMWVSSSAFEQVLNCSVCINPTQFGRSVDPWGDYIRRHIPELSNMPVEYIYEPWKAPPEVQEKAGCIIGKDYPAPIVDHKTVSRSNCQRMNAIKENLMKHLNKAPVHCAPSNEGETRQFMSFPAQCGKHNPECDCD